MRRLLLIMVCALMAIPAFCEPYVVTAKVLNLRVAPSTESEVATAVMRNVEVDVIAIDGDWATVNYNGKTYYAAQQYLLAVASPEKQTFNKPDAPAFLSDIFKGVSNGSAPGELIYVILVLVVLSAVFTLANDNEAVLSPKGFYIIATMFLAACALELYYCRDYPGDPTWFCSPDKVGWLWTVINFILFAILCIVQAFTMYVLNMASHVHGERGVNTNVGWILTGVAGVAFFVSGFFFQEYAMTVLYVDLAGLACWMLWMVYCNARDHGSWLNLIYSMVLWLVTIAGTLVICYHFLVLAILVACAIIAFWFVLAMVSPRKGVLRDSSGKKVNVTIDPVSGDAWEGGLFGRNFKRDPYDSDKFIEQ